jgi:hypothetical protein
MHESLPAILLILLQETDLDLGPVLAGVPGNVHGVACWFDVLFDGSSSQRWLSTAPGVPTTHWCALSLKIAKPEGSFCSQSAADPTSLQLDYLIRDA